MNYYTLPNLVLPNVSIPSKHLSDLKFKVPKLADKEAFRDWCRDDTIKHCFYSTVEGVNPHTRINNGNPSHLMHGFVGDYDGQGALDPDNQAMIDAIIKKGNDGWLPTWFSRTYSGKVRLIWEFESPMLVENDAISEKFINALIVATKCKTIIKNGGWDPVSQNLAMYWEVGTQWTRISDDPLSEAALETLFFDVATKSMGPSGKVNIPIEVVAAEIEERFPNKWPGEFDVGRRGPLFWVEDGIDRVGCVVQPGGIWCYSSRAGKNFVSWGEILGEDFVSKYRERQLSDALEDTYFDGKKYWLKARGTWAPTQKEDMMMRLRLAGFSHNARKKGDPASQIDEVLVYVQDERRIYGAAPFIFNSNELVEQDHRLYINTHSHVVPMAPGDRGDPAYWPNLFDWFSNFMDGGSSFHAVMAWMQYFYRGALAGKPEQGHSLIIAGWPDKGKSLFSTFVLRRIFAGATDAGAYLMGEEKFNPQLCESAIWFIDDNEGAASFAQKKRFSEAIKKMTATPIVTVRAAYSDPVQLERRGRIVLTTNTDADSLAILPNLDGTILDKLIIVKMREDHKPWFLKCSSYEIESTIEKELPFFLHWLLNSYVAPDWLSKGASSRFGINAFHHPDIMTMAKDLSYEQRSWEVIQLWWAERPNSSTWEGNVSALLGEMDGCDSLRPFTRNLTPVSFGMTMAKLSSTHPNEIKRISDSGGVRYEVNLS